MKEKHIKISDSAKEELREATINGNVLHLRPNIKNYAELKKIFATIGVTWKKQMNAHLLAPGAKEQIDHILNGGQVVDEKKTLQAFYTPHDLVDEVADLCEVDGMHCLEPSCGDGRMVNAMLKRGAKSVLGMDINEKEIKELQSQCSYRCRELIVKDFLQFFPPHKFFDNPTGEFDRILMNPPYNVNTWVSHVSHAWSMLKGGGLMVAIVPDNLSKDQFVNFINGKIHTTKKVPHGAFKESGTNIATRILKIFK